MSLTRTKSVHIAPQGYETQRVYEPAIESDADIVVLLIHPVRTAQGDDCKEEVMAELDEAGVEWKQEKCDFFDLYRTLKSFGRVIERYSDEEIFVNLSTGSKITAIGGAVACMATAVQPYYVKVKGYEGRTISTGVDEAVPLNIYPIGLPNIQYLEVMRFLEENDEVIKKDVLEFVQENEFPLLSRYSRKELRNNYGPLNREILDPLETRGMIVQKRIGQGKRVLLTEDGENTLEAFEYLLDDR